MAASSYRTSMHELDDDDVHRLLPREILEEIGVVIVDPEERQVLDVVDDLAARLASVLGGAPKMRTPCHGHHHPQVNGGRGSLGGGEGTVVRRVVAVPPPPPFLPSPPAVPWQVMEGLMRRNSMVIHPTATMPGAWPLAGGAPPTTTAVRRGTGTGVFLPRAEVARRAAKAARSPPLGNGNHARVLHQRARVIHQRGQQEIRAVVAAHMELRSYHLGVHVLPH